MLLQDGDMTDTEYTYTIPMVSTFADATAVPVRAQGLDTSHHDIYFRPAESQHRIDFAILRTGYGIMPDRIFVDSATNVANSDIPVPMVYHYLSTGAPITDQVNNMLSMVAKTPLKPRAYWWDFETYYNEMNVGFAYELKQAIELTKQKTGSVVGLYTNMWLYNEYVSKSGDWHLTTPFWYSWPTTAYDPFTQNPYLPASRKDGGWSIWQYNFNGVGTEWGLGRSYAADLDVYNGTLEDLKAWVGIGDEPENPEPEPEEPCSCCAAVIEWLKKIPDCLKDAIG